jgi:membrane protein
MKFIKNMFHVFVQSAKDFSSDNAMKFSASLSYYTTFSIAPMLIIIIGLAGIFFGRDAVQGEVYRQFSGLIGPSAADFLQTAIGNMEISGKSWLATIIGIVTLLLGATGVFTELQDSLNQIWSLKAKPRKGIVQYLLNRVISFSMVLTLGFMLIVSLLVNTVINLLSERIFSVYEEWAWIAQTLNIAFIIAIVTVLFAFMFKFLPDAKIAWKHVWVGALFTSGLFLLGKFGIGFYLSNSSIATSFGGAGSLAILLAWVYYSSAILFFGAEFTKNYSIANGHKIVANDYANFVVPAEKELPKNSDVQKMQEVKHRTGA